MTDILDRLITDHNRLRRLLALFQRELDCFEREEDFDLQLMQDITQYYSEYFNRVHHPLEDCLFEDLLLHGLPRFESARRALGEHAELVASTALLRAQLDKGLHGQIISRQELIEAGRQYIDFNLSHIGHEEDAIFAWARERMDEIEWTAVNQWLKANASHARYTALLQKEIDAFAP